MDRTQRHLVAGLVVLLGGLLVGMAAIERLGSPTLRALGGREQLIMVALLMIGVAIGILGACETAGFAPLPNILPSVIVCVGAAFAAIDVFRIYVDSLRWLGDAPGPLGAVPPSNNRMLFFGALLSCGGGVLMELARQKDGVPEAKAVDSSKTYHADRWWRRDASGSVLVWDDQAQAWSPWVDGRDPGLPPGW